MKNVAIIGASGYTGAELVKIIDRHPALQISHLLVSENSPNHGQHLGQLYPELAHLNAPLLQESNAHSLAEAAHADLVVLATEHEVSAHLAPIFLAHGKPVFDLSGGFRLASNEQYQQYYGFSHPHPEWLDKAVYGLADYHQTQIVDAQLIAVPGCYPTASLLALKPLQMAGVLSADNIIINAVSGVTGAGRKAKVNLLFGEVSLQAYGLFGHRHRPEISQYLGAPVLFTPHLGNFKRGILATIYAQLNEPMSKEQLWQIYEQRYADAPLVRLSKQHQPSINAVAGSAFCDLHIAVEGKQLIITSAIDNLLKGAAGQAVQCINLKLGLAPSTGLL